MVVNGGRRRRSIVRWRRLMVMPGVCGASAKSRCGLPLPYSFLAYIQHRTRRTGASSSPSSEGHGLQPPLVLHAASLSPPSFSPLPPSPPTPQPPPKPAPHLLRVQRRADGPGRGSRLLHLLRRPPLGALAAGAAQLAHQLAQLRARLQHLAGRYTPRCVRRGVRHSGQRREGGWRRLCDLKTVNP